MSTSAADRCYWSAKLFALLREMAAENTNAVLILLAEVSHLQTQCRYPENGLVFADGHWRAFYHCHDSMSIHEKEHGHFHLFTDIGNQSWAHVAGLSIDTEGQPLQWFTVNRWVTDGPWLAVEKFAGQLKYITAKNTQENLVTDWLGILVQLYANDLHALLIKRDKKVQNCLKGRSQLQTLEDQDIYQLSAQTIDLANTLEKYLLDNNSLMPEMIDSNEQVLHGV